MLYVSTRNKTDSFTAHRTLCADRAPDGGLFVPYMIPKYFPDGSFDQIIADVLNLYFYSNLTPRDIELCIGRQPVRLKEMSYRLLVAEFFHNPDGKYQYIEDNLYKKLAGSDMQGEITLWARITIRIALLFAAYSVVADELDDGCDIAVTVGDFTTPLSVWYARQMGLPIGMIICSCNENCAAWDLIQRGEMNTGLAKVDTAMPDLDFSCPQLLECLIYQTLGMDEAVRYSQVCESKGNYSISDDQFSVFSAGLSAAVVSRDRIGGLISNVRSACDYRLTDRAAISYGGMQDYRARTGESKKTMIFMDSVPSCT